MKISQREYLERIIDERDKQYDMRFRAAEIAVQAALLAQKEGVINAFSASEKAIGKAEDAQKAYNVAHNDISRKMDEQNKATMPRPEILALFKSDDDKLEAMRFFFDSKLESQRVAFEKSNEALLKEIGGLRDARSEASGKSLGMNALGGYLVAIAGIVLALVFHFIK